jgi:spore photoproduct lyase
MRKIYITEDIKNHKKGIEILEKLSSYEVVESEKTFIDMILSKNLSYEEEKKYMLFTVKKGKFLKKYHLDKQFLGIKEEYYLSYENNCPFNCLYCYLRDYFSHGAFVFYVNLEDMFSELDGFTKKMSMISAGIVNDSLVLDSITNVTKDLLDYFKNRKDLVLELRTKSHNIKNLLELEPIENLLVSFTFSPQEIIDRYELKSSSLEARIEAARKLQEKGYSLGLRFDPIINIESRKLHYGKMIDKVFQNLDCAKIRDIGIGGLRYKKGLRQKVLAERNTDLFFNELVIGIDGKERYFKKIRIDMYKEMTEKIKLYGDFDVYLGMEPKYVWDQIF